jgi:hypothetical protein
LDAVAATTIKTTSQAWDCESAPVAAIDSPARAIRDPESDMCERCLGEARRAHRPVMMAAVTALR